MTRLRRAAFFALLFVLFVAYLVKCHLQDISEQYRAGAYFAAWLNNHRDPEYHGLMSYLGDEVEDKIIVMARLEEENAEWVEEELPDWQRAIYIVNPSNTTLADDTQFKNPINKGHESMAYLTYIIDHYDTLPSTIVFLHAHRSGFFKAWHNDAPLHDNVMTMRALQLDFVQRNGYVNLRCNWNPGCKESHRENAHVTPDVWREIFERTSTPPPPPPPPPPTPANISVIEKETKKEAIMPIPSQIGAACCAQFAVSRTQVQLRPREDYLHFRQWVMETNKTDAASGRVMEFLWHVIFGMQAVYCPDEEVCYCQVYGRC